jgi:hypothetical protein
MHWNREQSKMAKQSLGDKPIDGTYAELMVDVARTLDVTLNGHLKGLDRKVGFILMVFEFGDVGEPPGGRCNYISNADRASVKDLLRDQLKKFEKDDKAK